MKDKLNLSTSHDCNHLLYSAGLVFSFFIHINYYLTKKNNFSRFVSSDDSNSS